ncbi:MAG: hypothetical protein QF570_05130 [Myxococcota bacterium]|jgi:hypothetical protein|nr:hypothetical protein [Myxococcota bacterium]
MENWVGIFTLIISAMVINLVVAFVVLRVLASAVGVSPLANTAKEALHVLVTIVPVAGVAGAPFIIVPFIGPLFGFFVSCCVAPMMLAPRYEISQGEAAKIILPTVAAIYVTTALILWFGIPMVI